MSLDSHFWVSLAPLSVILPFLGAAVTLVLIRHPLLQRGISIFVLTITFVLECIILLSIWDQEQPVAIDMGNWESPFGIVLVVDQFAALMLVVSSLVSLAVLLYATGQDSDDEDDESGEPAVIFHPTYMILSAGVSYAFIAGDLFNLYVGFEILLTASYVLLTLGGTGDRIRAAITYVIVSVISSLIFLTAIAMIYGATGTLNMADLAVKLSNLPEGTQNTLHVLLLVAFGIKAAIFPLSFWLPDSYPTAPAPVTAVFAGLLTKVGIYSIARTETLLFPDSSLTEPLMILGLFTMIVGILGAIAQTDIKRVLSFTLVSSIGYMVFGIALGNELGLTSAIFYAAHTIIIQTTLFLVVGLIEWRAGTTSIAKLGGLAKISPFIAVMFFIPAMNLAGIPPLSGFLAKNGLVQAGVDYDSPVGWVLVAGAVITSLLTLLVVARIWNRGFWRPAADTEEENPMLTEPPIKRSIPKSMAAPTAILFTVGLALTVFAGPLFDLSEQAAQSMQDRLRYVGAVLGDKGVNELKKHEEAYSYFNHGKTYPDLEKKKGED